MCKTYRWVKSFISSLALKHLHNGPYPSLLYIPHSYGVTYLGIFDNSLQYLDPTFSLHPSSYIAANRTRIIGHPVVQKHIFKPWCGEGLPGPHLELRSLVHRRSRPQLRGLVRYIYIYIYM